MQLSTLDVLRAFAVFAVLFSHLPINSENISALHVEKLGLFGVGIFFIHTFLVLLFSFERNLNYLGHIDTVKKFFIERFFRIYPLSIVVVSICFIFFEYFISFKPSLFDFYSCVFLLQNITGGRSIPGTLWSLPFEIQMYLTLPLIYVFYKIKPSLYLIFTLIIPGCLIPFFLWYFKFHFGILSFAPCFLVGLLSFHLYKIGKFSQLWFLTWQIQLVILTALGVGFSNIIFYTSSLNIPDAFILWPFCLILSLCLPLFKQISSSIINQFFHEIAKYSYSIYLLHAPIIYFCFNYLPNLSISVRYVIFGPVLIISVMIGYHVVEKPFIRFGRVVTKKLNHVFFH